MRILVRVVLTGLLCAGAAGAVVMLMARDNSSRPKWEMVEGPSRANPPGPTSTPQPPASKPARLPLFGEEFVDDSGFGARWLAHGTDRGSRLDRAGSRGLPDPRSAQA